MKAFSKLVLASLLASTALSAYADVCNTHTVCPVGQVCHCTLPANGIYNDAYFYFDTPLTPGHTYQCSLTSSPVTLTFNSGSLPAGATAKWPTTRTPMSFSYNTTTMRESTGTGSLKVLLPGTDMASDATFSCKQVS